jgi:hypothetical protein
VKITSSAFSHNEKLPKKYTCDGEDINPPLEFDNIPGGTVSLVLIVEDPDAPGQIFNHWTVWNIENTTRKIAEGAGAPSKSNQGITDFGKSGYGGACPPKGHGKHRYRFRLYALDSFLDLGPNTSREELLDAMKGHVLDGAELVGTYER